MKGREAAVATAVISDIHGNVVALRAVLADIERRGCDRIICLGDTVGYGPDPLECVDLVQERCAWALMGNHDYGVLYEPTNFNIDAESSAFWTREQFEIEPDAEKRARRYDFLNRLRVRVVETVAGTGNGSESGEELSLLAVHGSPRRPINEYIFPDDPINNPDKMEGIFERVPRICVVGHTHVPGVFTDEPDFYPPDELGEGGYKFMADERAIINVGSVGQPRDFDPRSSYVILHPTHAEFVRVEYDVEETASKIRSIPELPQRLADRLLKGT